MSIKILIIKILVVISVWIYQFITNEITYITNELNHSVIVYNIMYHYDYQRIIILTMNQYLFQIDIHYLSGIYQKIPKNNGCNPALDFALSIRE